MIENDSTAPAADQLPHDKERYRRLIEAGRLTLSDDELAVLLALYEEDTAALAAESLGMREGQIVEVLAGMLEKRMPSPPERLNRQGKPYLKRLGRIAYRKVLEEFDELEVDERRIIEAAAASPNQIIAAQSLGLDFKEYLKQHIEIRRKYGF